MSDWERITDWAKDGRWFRVQYCELQEGEEDLGTVIVRLYFKTLPITSISCPSAGIGAGETLGEAFDDALLHAEKMGHDKQK